MKSCRWIWVAAAFALSPVQPANAKSVHKEFSEVWTERLSRYDMEYRTAKSTFETAMAAFRSAAAANTPDLSAKLETLWAASDDFGYRAGRAQMSQTFLQFIEDKPSAERGELWFQDQVDRLTQADNEARSQFDRAKAMKIGVSGVTADAVFTSFGAALFTGGTVRGQVAELSLINQNLTTYYRARSQQDAERRARWGAALGAMGQSLQAQAQANRGWTARCTTFGQTTNCSGN